MQVTFEKACSKRHHTTCLLLRWLLCLSQGPQLVNAQEQTGRQLGNLINNQSPLDALLELLVVPRQEFGQSEFSAEMATSCGGRSFM